LQAGIEKQDKGAQVYSALGLADLARQDGNIVAAQQYTDQMANLLGPSEPPDSVMSLKLAIARGRLAFIGGKLDEARKQFGKALSVQKSKPTTIDAELAVVDLDLLVGNTFDAMASARHALDISTSLQGGLPYSRRTGLSWLAIGRSYQARGDRAEAHAAFESAVTHLSNTLDADHPSLVQARELSSATAAAL
jgi:tetratricopeptide (TPR) repeat protein